MADARLRRLAQEVLLTSFMGPDDGSREPWAIDRIVEHVDELDVAPGDVLFREGDPTEHLVFVTDGRVRMKAEGHPDWVYRGDWVLGTTDLLAERRRGRTAIVEAPSTIFRVPAHVWYELVRDQYQLTSTAVIASARLNVGLYPRLAPTGGFAPPVDRRARFDVREETLIDRTLLLHEAPYFRQAGVQSLIDLARLAEIVSFAPGEALFAAGARPRRLFVLASGEVEAARADPRVCGRFGPGAVVGGAVAFGDEEAAWGATAITAADALALELADWADAMEEHSGLARAALLESSLERERLLDLLAAPTGEIVLD